LAFSLGLRLRFEASFTASGRADLGCRFQVDVVSAWKILALAILNFECDPQNQSGTFFAIRFRNCSKRLGIFTSAWSRVDISHQVVDANIHATITMMVTISETDGKGSFLALKLNSVASVLHRYINTAKLADADSALS